MSENTLLVVVLLSTTLLVAVYRTLAQRRHWFDVPNQRSSHQQPIPRGAGVIFALVMSVLVVTADLPWPLALSLLSGSLIAATGWYDDVRGLGARVRFLIYLVVNVGVVAVIWPLRPFGWINLVAIAGVALALTWWSNLYNFMDGINGIATLQGVFMALSAAWLSHLHADAEAGIYPLLVATLLGFLPWNFPRAKVFMGDAGSAFLGFLLGTLALWSIVRDSMTVWQWLILGGVFIVDASYTLLMRVTTGQRWYHAHRSHAYQRLADRTGSHARAVLVLMLINVMWLLPLAWWVRESSSSQIGYLCLAYIPLLMGCLALKAGKVLE